MFQRQEPARSEAAARMVHSSPQEPEPAQTQRGALLAALAKHAFVGGLERRFVQELAGFARGVSYAPGTLLARAGDRADSLLLLTAGQVELWPSEGAPASNVVRLGPGEVLGVDCALSPYWTRDVRAVGEVKAIALDGVGLERLMHDEVELRSALKMCGVRYARLRALRGAGKSNYAVFAGIHG